MKMKEAIFTFIQLSNPDKNLKKRIIRNYKTLWPCLI